VPGKSLASCRAWHHPTLSPVASILRPKTTRGGSALDGDSWASSSFQLAPCWLAAAGKECGGNCGRQTTTRYLKPLARASWIGSSAPALRAYQVPTIQPWCLPCLPCPALHPAPPPPSPTHSPTHPPHSPTPLTHPPIHPSTNSPIHRLTGPPPAHLPSPPPLRSLPFHPRAARKGQYFNGPCNPTSAPHSRKPSVAQRVSSPSTPVQD
jgi:hypothetical protein